MRDGGEGPGTAIEGGVAAAVAEPSGSFDDGHTHETACLNCGAGLVGAYCAACGQHAHLHRTIGALFHDILHGVLHFEGKTWSTLPKLVWTPGDLTRRYIEGERVRFVSPMAMFLFSVFVMFAVFQVMGIAPPAETGGNLTQTQLHKVEKGLLAERKALEAQLAKVGDDATVRSGLEAQLRQKESELTTVRALPGYGQEALQEEKFKAFRSGWKRLDKGIEKWRKNPGLMLYKLQTTAYKFSWLLIPLSVPFVALLFVWRRRFGFYDHAVFVTYSLAFMSFMGIVLTIAGGLGATSEVLISIFAVVALVHIYRHLRGTYELSHLSTLWRWIVLVVMVQMICAVFLMVLIFLGLIG